MNWSPSLASWGLPEDFISVLSPQKTPEEAYERNPFMKKQYLGTWKFLALTQKRLSFLNTWNSWSYCNPRESDHDGGNSSFSSSSVVGKTKWLVDSCLCARTLDDWINVTRPIGNGIKINKFILIHQQMALVLDLSYVRKSCRMWIWNIWIGS